MVSAVIKPVEKLAFISFPLSAVPISPAKFVSPVTEPVAKLADIMLFSPPSYISPNRPISPPKSVSPTTLPIEKLPVIELLEVIEPISPPTILLPVTLPVA